MLEIKLNFLSTLPLHRQVRDHIFKAIENGAFEQGERLPSIKKLSENCAVSSITIERGYRHLVKSGLISYVKGKGYYVRQETNLKLKILLVVNKLSSYKKLIYYSFLDVLGDNAKVVMQVHHYDPKILKEIIAENLGKYNYYVIMPHFFSDAVKEEYLDTLSSIPKDELVLMDKNVPELGNDFIAVYQDFEHDIYDAFESASDVLEKYDRIIVLFAAQSNHPPEILKGADVFCKQHKKELLILEGVEDEPLVKGAVYVVTSESELAVLIKRAQALNFILGKDIGIISFNETALKELLNITVITTDWQQMGATTGELILNKKCLQVKNSFKMIRRASL